MDAIKLKNSCICGNTLPYAECCGLFQAPPAESGDASDRAAFRHDLHELFMYLFPLRNLYQVYWERLSEEEYPHHLLMADPDYGRAMMANFFWDYSVQFSDARPILRAARDIEEKNLRLANDFRQWSLSPFWLWYVIESDHQHAYIRMADSDRARRVEHGGELPEPGRYFAARILSYRGKEQVHPGLLVFPEGAANVLPDRLRGICKALGVKSGSGLRPDVQCEEWRRHGALLLSLWRETMYDARVGIPSRTVSSPHSFHLPAPERWNTARQLQEGGAVAMGRNRFELRYRALTLARLEASNAGLQVTLLDEAYRPYVFHWLGDHLGMASGASPGAAPEALAAPAPGDWKAWTRAAHENLNGETPMEASLHDFGRRRLRVLLGELPLKEAELSALQRQLGL